MDRVVEILFGEIDLRREIDAGELEFRADSQSRFIEMPEFELGFVGCG